MVDWLDRSGRCNKSDYTVDGLRSLRAARMFELAVIEPCIGGIETYCDAVVDRMITGITVTAIKASQSFRFAHRQSFSFMSSRVLYK